MTETQGKTATVQIRASELATELTKDKRKYDNRSMTRRFYVDDAEEGTASGPFNAQASGTNTGDTRIGYSTSFSATPMAGDIARVDYYSKELTAQEVDNLHATGRING